jgi:hypothetical protein
MVRFWLRIMVRLWLRIMAKLWLRIMASLWLWLRIMASLWLRIMARLWLVSTAYKNSNKVLILSKFCNTDYKIIVIFIFSTKLDSGIMNISHCNIFMVLIIQY